MTAFWGKCQLLRSNSWFKRKLKRGISFVFWVNIGAGLGMLQAQGKPPVRLHYGGGAGKVFKLRLLWACFAMLDVRQEAGRAKFDQLRRAAGRRLFQKKMQTWTFAFFSSSRRTTTWSALYRPL
jgi:hypothetical protein